VITDGLVGRWMIPAQFVTGKDQLYIELRAVPFWSCPACEFCEARG
jgi:hypothetical protein